jgi:hypothetical protein
MMILFRFGTAMKLLLTSLLLACACAAQPAQFNFADKKTILVDVCPFIQLSDFSIKNYSDASNTELSWTNTGSQPVIAFEIVILRYDPFDRRMVGDRILVTGTDSANWKPLVPGARGSDGVRMRGSDTTYTAVAYVRLARLADGTIWSVNDLKLASEIKKAIKDPGDLKPDAPVSKSK